jgi:hypothetical protein
MGHEIRPAYGPKKNAFLISIVRRKIKIKIKIEIKIAFFLGPYAGLSGLNFLIILDPGLTPWAIHRPSLRDSRAVI